MRVRDLGLLRPRRPPAPYGVRRLARVDSIADLAAVARRRLPHAPLAYLEGGGEDEYTLRRNRAAFDEIELVPRILHDVSTVDTATTVLGTRCPVPVALAPIGAVGFIHHEGERAVARAAAAVGIPYAISTVGSTAVDELAGEADGLLWLQLYVWGDRHDAEALIERAQAAGYHALIVTADVSVRSKRERERRAGLALPTPHPTLRTVLDAALHPTWSWRFLTTGVPAFPNAREDEALTRDLSGMWDGTVSWDDVDWIRRSWNGPLVLKGVLDPADARRAVDAGCDAIIVSNHGGRQLDHVPATIDALPGVAGAVGGQIEVLLDSGIRRGTDILAALALGAGSVLIGRAHLYGLAAAGEAGVRHAIDILHAELRTAMALAGVASLDELDPELVRRRS